MVVAAAGCVVCCFCFAWIAVIFSVVGIHDMGDFLNKAEAWDDSTMWQQATCEVLASGVSCTDKESRSTCSGYKAGAMPSTQPPVFLTEQIAVCPGTYWCAKEGELCRCNGEITYAPELFDGYVYTVPSAEMSYKVASSSTWKCGTDQSGKPYAMDPAPWHVKHCWCTPQGILDILKKHDASTLHKKECSEAVNFDFDRPARRLEEGPQAVRHVDTEEDEEEDDEELIEGEDLEDTGPRALLSRHMVDAAPARSLKGDSRRRRTYSYTPWALVSLKKESFDSLDAEDGNKQISCAYEFGVPAASSALYKSDGPYQSADVWRAEDVAKKWGSVSSRPCWVRARSDGVKGLADCAPALDKPGALTDEATAKTELAQRRLWIFLGLSVFCTGGLIFLLVQRVLSYQERSTDSREARSDQEGLVTHSL
mmetsp:Transcript_8239/g.19719  ORF Transcript_8239/g.19719 Transcript_8239/m.19719 type:complete len:424 (-) Transcript_8239:54-1325(-)